VADGLGWTAYGIVEAPVDEVTAALLRVRPGRVGPDNAPLLRAIAGAGRFLTGAELRGGPEKFTLHYGDSPQAGGTVEVGERYFAMQGGYKFRAEYRFAPHERGTLLTYRAINVAPAAHREKTLVKLQFRLGGALRIGLRGALRTIGTHLNCRAYPA
jgi:hypothetical protein